MKNCGMGGFLHNLSDFFIGVLAWVLNACVVIVPALVAVRVGRGRHWSVGFVAFCALVALAVFVYINAHQIVRIAQEAGQ